MLVIDRRFVYVQPVIGFAVEIASLPLSEPLPLLAGSLHSCMNKVFTTLLENYHTIYHIQETFDRSRTLIL